MARRGTDNSSVELKLAVREWVASRVAQPWHVLDLYCGCNGEMYQGIWSRAEVYFGVDKFNPHKLANTARMSAEVASQRFDLDRYNIFDVDCYASPWAVARRILLRRGAGAFGIILTNGEERGFKNGNSNELVRATLGLSGFSDLRLLVRYSDLVIDLMIRSLLEIPGIRFVAGIKGTVHKTNSMRYIGLVLDKLCDV